MFSDTYLNSTVTAFHCFAIINYFNYLVATSAYCVVGSGIVSMKIGTYIVLAFSLLPSQNLKTLNLFAGFPL